MTYVEKGRKKFQSQILFILDPGKKIPKKIVKNFKKIKKPLCGIIFSQNGMRQTEKEKKKKNLVRNSVHTRPEQENSGENSKKIKKIKKPLSGIIFIQNGMRQAEKEKKNFSPEFRSYSTGLENSEKNSKRIQKIKEPFSGIISSQNGMRQAEREKKKKFSPEFRSYSTRLRKF